MQTFHCGRREGNKEYIVLCTISKEVHGKVCFHKNSIVIRVCCNKGNLERTESYLRLAHLYCPQCKAR
jgi:hypothetical protein